MRFSAVQKQWHLKMGTSSVCCLNGRIVKERKTRSVFAVIVKRDRLKCGCVIDQYTDSISSDWRSIDDWFKNGAKSSSYHRFIIRQQNVSHSLNRSFAFRQSTLKTSLELSQCCAFSLESARFVWDCACASLFVLLPVLFDRLVHIA